MIRFVKTICIFCLIIFFLNSCARSYTDRFYDILSMTDQNELAEIAIENEENYGILASLAAQHITDQEILTRVAFTAKTTRSRATATENITSQETLTKIAKSVDDIFKDARIEAFVKLKDQKIKGEIARGEVAKWKEGDLYYEDRLLRGFTNTAIMASIVQVAKPNLRLHILSVIKDSIKIPRKLIQEYFPQIALLESDNDVFIEGVFVSSKPKTPVMLSPGNHKIIVRYHSYLESKYSKVSTQLVFNAYAGHFYVIKAKINLLEMSWMPYIEDCTY